MKKEKVKKEKPNYALDFMKKLRDKGNSVFMEETEPPLTIPCVVPGFKRAVGVDIPHGTVIILHGPPAGGKTALAALMIVSYQKDNLPSKFYDIECAADVKKWILSLGVDLKSCLYDKGMTLEELIMDVSSTLKIYDEGMKAKSIPKEMSMLHVCDSLSMAGTDSTIKRMEESKKTEEISKRNYSDSAIVLTDWFKVLIPHLDRTGNTGVFIVHERANMNATAFGKKTQHSGPSILNFANCLRISVWSKKYEVIVNKEKVPAGKQHTCTIEKNKFGPDKRSFCFFTSNGTDSPLGYDEVRTYIHEAMELGIVTKPGKGKIKFNNEIYEGESNFRKILREGLITELKDVVNNYNSPK